MPVKECDVEGEEKVVLNQTPGEGRRGEVVIVVAAVREGWCELVVVMMVLAMISRLDETSRIVERRVVIWHIPRRRVRVGPGQSHGTRAIRWRKW